MLILYDARGMESRYQTARRFCTSRSRHFVTFIRISRLEGYNGYLAGYDHFAIAHPQKLTSLLCFFNERITASKSLIRARAHSGSPLNSGTCAELTECALIFAVQLRVFFDGILKRDAKFYGRVGIGTACVYVSVGRRPSICDEMVLNQSE